MIKRLAVFTVVLTMLAVSPVAGVAPATVQAQDDGNISNPNPGIDTFAWTEEAMANAQPMPLLMREGRPQSGPATFSAGEVHTSPPAGPGGREILSTSAQNSGITLFANGYDYPPPFTRYTEFGNGNRYPNSTIGTLFFTQNSVAYRCSGAIAYRNIVWTAGHCVHDGSGTGAGWSSDFVFYPAWRNGAVNPLYGSYSNDINVWTRTAWYNGEIGEDMGVVVFDNTGGYLGDNIGYLGFQTGVSSVQNWSLFGYPSVAPFNGNNLVSCRTSYSRMDTSTTPDTVGFGCDMTGGSSGGPGIRRFSGAGGWINTHMSYGYIGFGQEAFGPYFGNNAWSLFCQAIETGTGVDHPGCP